MSVVCLSLLQECATVPANPFPEPTNGKAISRWKQVHDVLVLPETATATATATASPPNDSNGHSFQHATASVGGWGSPAVAGVVEAVMTAAAAFKAGAGGESGGSGGEASTASCSPSSSARLCKKARPEPDSIIQGQGQGSRRGLARGRCGDGDGCGGDDDAGTSASGRTSPEGPQPSQPCQEEREQREYSPEPSPKSSEPVLLGDTRGAGAGAGGDGNGSSSKGMRQESYYLRGVIEADRDENFVATIANCIPGKHLQ